MRSPCGTSATPTMTRSSASMIGASVSAAPPSEASIDRPELLLHQRAGRIGWAERLVARDVRHDLVVVPGLLRFLRLLDLHQDQVVHHQAVLAQPAVAREEVVDRMRAHLGR